MIFNTTYPNKEITRQINNELGKSFSLRERWKLKGIGSKRMVIKDISEEYKKYLKADHYDTNANIELRPNGILIHFRHKLEVYSWVMPYSKLSIATNDELGLKSEGKFITFKIESVDQVFVEKMIKESKA